MFGGMKIPPKMLTGNKSELKLGHIVQLRNGELGKIAQNEVHCNCKYIDQPISHGVIWLGDYKENLQCVVSEMDYYGRFKDKRIKDYDIVAIYEEQCIGNFLEFIKQGEKPKDIKYFNKVWEEKENTKG